MCNHKHKMGGYWVPKEEKIATQKENSIDSFSYYIECKLPNVNFIYLTKVV